MHIFKIFTLLRFYEELVKFIIVPKVILIGPFSFFKSKYILRFCLIIWYKLYYEYLVENESVIFLSQNGKYEFCFGRWKFMNLVGLIIILDRCTT